MTGAMEVHLVRHGSHALLGRMLCGRTIDIGLDAQGRRQAAALAAHFAGMKVDAVQSSARRRARETAQPIAAATGCNVEVMAALDEHDAGAWSGSALMTLDDDVRWRIWNARRGSARPPGGESMHELQQRVVAHLQRMRRSGIERVVMVSHAEPIRAAVMHSRAIALDDFLLVDIPPAGVSVLDLGRSWAGADCVAST